MTEQSSTGGVERFMESARSRWNFEEWQFVAIEQAVSDPECIRALAQRGSASDVLAAIDPFTRGAFTGWKGRDGYSTITLDEAEDHFSLCMADMMDAARAAAALATPQPASNAGGEPNIRDFIRTGILKFKEHELREIVAAFCKLPGIAPQPADPAYASPEEELAIRAAQIDERWRQAMRDLREMFIDGADLKVMERRVFDLIMFGPSVSSTPLCTPSSGHGGGNEG